MAFRVLVRESEDDVFIRSDMVRDLKRINSHLTTVAYPVLAPAAPV